MKGTITILFALYVCALSAQVPKSGPVVTVVLGEAVSNETWVYVSSIDGEAYKADGSDRTKYAHGLVHVGGSSGDTTQIFVSGLNPWESSSLNATNVYYLSAATPGTMTDVKPVNQGYVQALCVALSDTSIFITALPLVTNAVNSVYEITGSSPQTARVNVDNLVDLSISAPSYTIDLPDANDGDIVSLIFNETIATVSITADVTIVGTALTASVPGTVATYKFFATPDIWIRIK